MQPLRKVVEEFQTPEGFERERLECGHVVNRKQDHYGPTNAYRRRCRFCQPVESARAAAAVDPHASSTGKLSTRDKGFSS